MIDKNRTFWVVETRFDGGEWIGYIDAVYLTRKKARERCRSAKAYWLGEEYRVVKYVPETK